MNNSKKRRFKLNNKGYSLGELLVVIAIMGILAAAGIMGYGTWQNTSEFRYNNETAKMIYSILQEELSQRRAGNTLDEVTDRVKSLGNVDGTCGIVTNDIVEKIIAENSVSSLSSHRVYYINANSSCWKEYLGGGMSESRPEKVLYDLISGHILQGDSNLLNGSICAEFDPEEGVVYSVFFCRDIKEGIDNRLTYSSEAANYNMIDRSSTGRKSHGLVGYYGV